MFGAPVLKQCPRRFYKEGDVREGQRPGVPGKSLGWDRGTENSRLGLDPGQASKLRESGREKWLSLDMGWR